MDTTQQRESSGKRGINSRKKKIIFEIERKKLTKGQSRQLLFRWHSTIRFSLDDNVNILSPSLKSIHSNLTKPASF